MKSIILSLSCAISLLASTITFAQGAPGGPTGGGGTPSGLGYTINIVTIQGMDEVTAKHRDANGNIYSDHWTRDWLENGWRLNGASTSNGGLWVTGIAPTTPVANDGSINAPIEMTSQGTQKVTIQYNGDLQNMPSEIGIILTSTAKAYYQESGSALADNGLGNDSFYVGAGADYSLLGLAGQYSDGKNLRIIKLNSSGYGELTFSSSAEAHSSGYGARVWANAQSASATLDGRRVSLAGSYIPTISYIAGEEGTYVNPIHFTVGTANVYEQFTLRYWEPEIAKRKSTALASESMSFQVGIPVKSLKAGIDFFPPITDGNGLTFFYGEIEGTSSHPNGHTYYPVGPDSESHHYEFSLSQPNYNPNYSTLSGSIHLWNLTESRNYGHYFEGPYQIWNPETDPYVPFHTIWTPGDFQIKDLGEIHFLNFEVNYDDDVRGIASYEMELRNKGEHVEFSDTRELYDESLHYVSFDEVHASDVNSEGYVHAGSDTCAFYKEAEDTTFVLQGQIIKTARDVTNMIPIPFIESIVNFILSGAEYHIQLGHDANGTFTIDRPGYDRTKTQSELGIIEILGGDFQDYLDHRNDYSWKPVVQQPLLVKVETCRAYGSSGYEGTHYGVLTKPEPKNMSDYRKYKLSKEDINW